ncbi:hypothetical protein POM88_034916 [Heracleum sosnowskyi]|uniref:Uncharacterized protein n=1 Tax=Heracleum sosnowskyi TaxID=360622 RepID=A0AAD8MDL5_9APIA|nr:hypothetical protein POM88_034916 [Heracleum sosnowskyi]
MKRSSTRDISTFFTKKPTTENVSQAQANEPEINIPRSPATQPSQQGSSPTPSITLVPPQDFDTINYPQDPGKRKKLIDFHPNKRDLVRRTYIQRRKVSDTIDSNKAQSITHLLMSFDFVFVAHLMVAIFGITNELNVALQKHDQDIVNAMAMVDITKTSLQKLRDEGWNFHMDKVTSFLVKYGVEVPNMEANYIIPGRRMYRDRYQNMKTRREQL